jgi:hypothetical protein
MVEFRLTSDQTEFLLKLAKHSLKTANQGYLFAGFGEPRVATFLGIDRDSDDSEPWSCQSGLLRSPV